MCIVLLGRILENEDLAERLMEVLKRATPPQNGKSRRKS